MTEIPEHLRARASAARAKAERAEAAKAATPPPSEAGDEPTEMERAIGMALFWSDYCDGMTAGEFRGMVRLLAKAAELVKN